MATLPGQRATFTWTLNQYNLAEDDETRKLNAMRMAKIIERAPAYGFTVDQVTQKQTYPEAEVAKFLNQSIADMGSALSESQALNALQEAVDTSDVMRVGEGEEIVYAYGYRCAPDRLKIGRTAGDAVQRIFTQISTSTPDRPVLVLEIKTHDCGSLERAIHAALEYHSLRIRGAGKEWFKTSRDHIVNIYRTITHLSLEETTAPKPI